MNNLNKKHQHLSFCPESFRSHFPLICNSKTTYLDNAASTQKFDRVLERTHRFDSQEYSNVHRGVYRLSAKASEEFEASRTQIQHFIDANSPREVVFTRGATEAINLVAYSWGDKFIEAGDEIVISVAEHHANFVPWQQLCFRKGASLKVVGLNQEGGVAEEQVIASLSERTKLVAITGLSNVLGQEVNLRPVIKAAKERGVLVLVDAAQLIAQRRISVSDLDCDFLVFSGHKLFAPTGIGVLWGREEVLEQMPPFQFGGDMIRSVSIERTSFNELPYKFEAGTPHITGAIGLAAAIELLSELDFDAAYEHVSQLSCLVLNQLLELPQVRLLGPIKDRHAVISFIDSELHPLDLAEFLGNKEVAIRAGHHCAEPLMRYFDVEGSARLSLTFYNSEEDVNRFFEAYKQARAFYSRFS